MDNQKTTALTRRELLRYGLSLAGGAAMIGALSRCGNGETPLIRLAYNENPLGPCPAAREAMEAARTAPLTLTGLNRYPDFLQGDILETIADFHGLQPENVVTGCGSSEIFNIIAACFLREEGIVLCPDPTFSLPAEYARRWGGEVREVELSGDHRIDLDAMIMEVDQDTKVLYLCNPNNPTGRVIGRNDLESFLDTVWSENPETVVVLDEAYFHYVEDSGYSSGLEFLNAGPLVIIRTFSHAYGLAGARVGYALAHTDLADQLGGLEMNSLSETSFHWKLGANVNRIAEAGAIASLQSGSSHIDQVRELNRSVKAAYYQAFSELGFEYIPSEANFVMVNVGVPGNQMQAYLYRQGILVQAGDLFHSRYSDWIRVSTGTEEEGENFIKALREYSANAPVSENVPATDWYGY